MDFPTLITFNSILSLGEEEEIELGPAHARFPERWQDLSGTELCEWGMERQSTQNGRAQSVMTIFSVFFSVLLQNIHTLAVISWK